MADYHKMTDDDDPRQPAFPRENTVAVVSSNQTYVHSGCLEACCCARRYRLTPAELDNLRTTREKAQIKYNENNPAHQVSCTQGLLKQLWRHVFLDSDPPESGHSERWKDFGFQGTNPGTDFRGAGVLGLQQLLYFITNYAEDYRRIRAGAIDYPFAISALNITYFLIYHFQLNQRKDIAMPPQRLASAKCVVFRVLKTFCRLQTQSPEALDEIYSATVIFMHLEWLRLNKMQVLSIMEFSQAIGNAQNMVEQILLDSPRTIGEFIRMKTLRLIATE